MRRPIRSRVRKVFAAAALAALIGCSAPGGPPAADPVPHPLDPLTAEEYARAVELLRTAGHVDDASRFSNLDLRDPDKASVLAWRPGDSFGRAAFAVVKQGPRTFEAVVDLSNAAVESWTEIPGVQPSLLLEEFVGV
jgi:primary-amine oxidase